MAGKKEYESKTEEILIPIAERLGVRIYDVEYVKEGQDYYLRAYIDKDGGVTIEDCEAVSRALSDVIDQDDYIEDAYILEVSSPGLGRQLKKDRHFENSMGLEVDVKLYEAIDGCKEFTGILSGYDKNVIVIKSEDDEKHFDRNKVSSVRLTIDF